jgi:hypothetical protein
MATLYYLAGFSTSGTAQSMGATVGGAAATITAGTYAFSSLHSVMGTGNYTAFGTVIESSFNAAHAGTYHATWSSSTYKWTIYRETAGFTLAFSGAAALRLRAALGFSGNPSTAGTLADPHVSDVRPYYVMVPDITGRSEFTDLYEPDDIVEEAVSDGGTSYAVSRQTSELWCDWSQMMEPKAAVFTYAAAAATPWTWQAFVRHVRGQHPFGVYESATDDSCHKLRADGGSFKPGRYAADYDGLWTIPFLTRYLGAL